MNSEPTTFYIARHGETEFNVKRIFQGHVDSPLTALGVEQAKELGQRLKDVHFDAIFSSDLGRAKHTAELVKLDRELAVVTSEVIRERFYGKHEAVPEQQHRQELRELLEEYEKLSEQERFQKGFDDIESHDSTASRLIRFLRETAVAYPGKTILIIAHGTIMKSFLVKILGLSLGKFPTGSVANCAYIKVESDGLDFELKETYGIKYFKQP